MVRMTLRGVRLDPEEGAILDTLEMVDISRGGMGAMVGRPAYPGQRFILCLPISEKMGRRNVYATVTRCRRSEEGCLVGLQFDRAAVGEWSAVSTDALVAA